MPSKSSVFLTFAPFRSASLIMLVFICVLGASGCKLGTTNAASRGKELFETCEPCHGSDGAGNADFGAPNIAGMKSWYVEEELNKFRAGIRGAHFNDVEGMRMRAMAVSLSTDENARTVAAYVQSMPPVRHSGLLTGDAKAGEAAYATCSSCHGENGAGNEDLKAPQIAGVDDWYLATQLKKFKSGVRGTNPKDREGRLMRPMSRTLTDDDAIHNVVAYIETLKP